MIISKIRDVCVLGLFQQGSSRCFAKAVKGFFCLGLIGLLGASSGLAQLDFTQDDAGETELHRAVRALMIAPNGRQTIPEECASVLREGAAGINIQNNRGRTPLHLFVMDCNSQNDGMELFFELGADVTIVDDLGLTPLDHILLKYGVDLRLKALLSAESTKNYCLSLLMEVDYAEGEEDNSLITAQYLLLELLKKMKDNYEESVAMNRPGILSTMLGSRIDSFLDNIQDAIDEPAIDIAKENRSSPHFDKKFVIHALQQQMKVLEEVVASWMPSRVKSARNLVPESPQDDAYELQGNEVSYGEGWGDALEPSVVEDVVTLESILAEAQDPAVRAIVYFSSRCF